MTQTERLISHFNEAKENGKDCIHFFVGKYTGWNASVINALRNRGYTVERRNGNGSSWKMTQPN